MSNIYLGYHFTILPKESGSEILIAELGESVNTRRARPPERLAREPVGGAGPGKPPRAGAFARRAGGQTLVKNGSNAGQTLVKRDSGAFARARRRSNAGQKRVKRWSNAGQM